MLRLLSVNVGLPRDVSWRGKTVHTAIWKRPVQGRRMARRLNIDGDGQDDLMRRGGEHWAVFVYQIELLRLLAAPARVAANSAMDSSERISRSKGCPTTRCASGIAIESAGRSSK